MMARCTWCVPFRWLAAAALLASAYAVAHGQGEPRRSFAEAFGDGLAAIERGDLDRAVSDFQYTLTLDPHNEISAYNLACAHSLSGDAASAIEWLARAVDWGYEDIDHMLEDGDLAHARTHAAFWTAIADIQKRLPPSMRREIARPSETDRALDLVVMLRNEFGAGAGIVIGREGDRLHVATANHLVRRGRTESGPIEIQLRPLGARWHRAELMPELPASDLDLAIVAVPDVLDDLAFCELPLHMGGDSGRLRRGDRVSPVGYPNGIAWAMPLSPDGVAQASSAQIAFESQFIRVGFSGGALLDEDGEIVGMITADEPPLGRAIPLDQLLQAARNGPYPVQLTTPRERAAPSLLDAARRGDVPALARLLDNCAHPDELDENGRTALHAAAGTGLIDAVSVLLEANANPQVWGLVGEEDTARIWGTPLHVAAQSDNPVVARALLAAGADADLPTLYRFDADSTLRRHQTPLQIAAVHDAVGVGTLLLDAGAALEGVDAEEPTPLMVAADHGSARLATVLLERGAMLDDGGTEAGGARVPALHRAAGSGSTEVLSLLIERGASVNARSRGGSPLHHAAEHGQVETARLLIERGADVNARSNDADTPLHLAADNGASGLVRLLLSAGADPDASNERGFSPMRLAVERADLASIDALARAGADVGESLHLAIARDQSDAALVLVDAPGVDLTVRNQEGRQPLHLAAGRGQGSVVSALLSAGASVSATDFSDSGGGTPLHHAAEYGHTGAVRLLLEAEAPIDRPDESGRTALYRAAYEGHRPVVALLLEAGASPNISADYTNTRNTPVAVAASGGSPELLAMLLEAGGDPNDSGDGAWIGPLALAAATGSLENVSLLLKAGADVTGRPGTVSPLHHALNQADTAAEVIERLADAGSPVGALDGDGLTPLHRAAEARHADAVRVLLAKRAPVNAADERCGVTPLWRAVELQRYDETETLAVVEMLVNAGADVNARSRCAGETVLERVEQNGYTRIRAFLLSARSAGTAPGQ